MITTEIIATGSAYPDNIVTNQMLESLVETTDEWIVERTGIHQRHLSSGETLVELASKAAAIALDKSGIAADDIDLILAATVSGDMALPCLACDIQKNLGTTRAVAFDINAACAGFLFALNTAHMYIQSGMYKNAIVVGAEVLSKIVDYTDRSTCVLFGDGAGAVVVQASEHGIIHFLQGSDGSKGMVLSCENRPVISPFAKMSLADWKPGYVQMDGGEVYKFAVSTVPECILRTMEEANITQSDIKYYILHQANIRIIQSIAKRLQEPMDKFPINLDRYGNISAASIPGLLAEVNEKGMLQKGDKIVLSGFGAGLTYGATILTW